VLPTETSPQGLDAADWPGAARRNPSTSSATWLVRSSLAAWLQSEAVSAHRACGRLRILDVGCGVKPYYPYFAPYADSYVGVDIVDNPAAELRGSVEALPVEDASIDVVLCTQVLEHSDDPARAVAELRRVTAPGGRVLASTHGVQVYHPSPHDYWRWTHEGLRRLFTDNADWQELAVRPAGGTAACLGMLLSTFVEIGCKRARVPGLARAPVWVLNRTGRALDHRVALLREPVPGALFANLHVTAVAAGADP
jgi:SAM-dependent methyltransferase